MSDNIRGVIYKCGQSINQSRDIFKVA